MKETGEKIILPRIITVREGFRRFKCWRRGSPSPVRAALLDLQIKPDRARLARLQISAAVSRIKCVRCTHRKKGKVFSMNSLRTVARIKKIRDTLSLEQIDDLKRWLTVERLTYEKARARLLEQFGLKVSSGTMSTFYWEECVPGDDPQKEECSPAVLTDIVLQSKSPIRLTILKNGSRLSFKIGKQWKRGIVKRKSIIIGPDNPP